MMVQNMITEDETAQLQQVFVRLDENQDGKLQYKEVLKGYTEFFGEELAEEETRRIFALVDVDNNGEIDFSEFVTATVNRGALLQDDKLRQAFRFYDKDDSGSISIDEIKDVLGVGKSIDDHVWDQVVKEVDRDGNGEVDFDEFKEMMVKLLRDD